MKIKSSGHYFILFFFLFILPLSGFSAFNWVLEDADTPENGWDTSWVWFGNGTTLENIANRALVSSNVSFRGRTSLRFHFNNAGGAGYAGTSIATDPDNDGTPPDSGAEQTAGKNVSSYGCFSFWIKGDAVSDAPLVFKDSSGDESVPVNITNFVKVTADWQLVQIPTNRITWNSCDRSSLVEFQLRIDSGAPVVVGDYTFYMDNAVFTSLLPERPEQVNAADVQGTGVKIYLNLVNNAASYTLYRANSNNPSAAVKIKGFSFNENYYQDSGLLPGKDYFYWVKAFNSNGASLFSPVTIVHTAKDVSGSYLRYRKWLFDDTDSPHDGAWNWSFHSAWGGTTIEDAGYDLPVSTNTAYEGRTSIKFHFNFDGAANSGALAQFGTDTDGSGTPPDNEDEKKAGKDLSAYNYFSFFIKGDTDSDALIEFIDENGNSSQKLHLWDYVRVTPQWQQVQIDLDTYDWKYCDSSKVSIIQVVIESKDFYIPAKEFTFYMDNIAFLKQDDPTVKGQDKDYIHVYPNYLDDSTEEADLVFYNNKAGKVVINIFNEFGELIWEHKSDHPRGTGSVKWKKRSGLSSGIYFVFLKTENSVKTTKIVIIK